jgi:hypothetical protein
VNSESLHPYFFGEEQSPSPFDRCFLVCFQKKLLHRAHSCFYRLLASHIHSNSQRLSIVISLYVGTKKQICNAPVTLQSPAEPACLAALEKAMVKIALEVEVIATSWFQNIRKYLYPFEPRSEKYFDDARENYPWNHAQILL